MPAWLVAMLMNVLLKAVSSEGMKRALYVLLKELCRRNKWEFDDRIVDDLFLLNK